PGSPAWLDDGSGFLWMSESRGAWVLELRDPTGALVRAVTEPPFGLREIAGITPDGRAAIALAAQDPREQHVWRVPLDGSPPTALTAGGGVHSALSRHGVTVITSQLREGGTAVTAVRESGARAELPSVAERPALVPTTRLESVEAHGLRFYTAITEPR